MDLVCTNRDEISFIGSSYFLGMVISLLIFPRLSELYGRLKIIYCLMIFGFVSEGGILFFSFTLRSLYIYYFINGIAATIAVCVGYIYLMEFLPDNKKGLYSTILLAVLPLPSILYPMYFLYISKNWLYFHIPLFLLTLASGFAIYYIPESPKYLFF